MWKYISQKKKMKLHCYIIIILYYTIIIILIMVWYSRSSELAKHVVSYEISKYTQPNNVSRYDSYIFWPCLLLISFLFSTLYQSQYDRHAKNQR